MSTDRAPGPTRRPTAGADLRITVAVITRDRSGSLLRTLGALAALPERPPVIVVDNSRHDTTREAVHGHPAVTRLPRPAADTGAVGRKPGRPAGPHPLCRLQRRRLLVDPGLPAARPTCSTCTHGSGCSPPAPWSVSGAPRTR